MSKKVENDIRMAQAVHEVLNDNENIWKDVKAFVFEVQESRDFMKLLKAARISVQKKSKGTTMDKANLQEAAIVMCVDLSERACVYLRKNKLMEMYEQVNVTKSDLRLTPDNDLVAKLRNIHKQLFSIVDKIADYNVSKENLEALEMAIADFDEMVPKPRGIQIKNQGYIVNISNTIKYQAAFIMAMQMIQAFTKGMEIVCM